jgi:ABC-type Fe3+-hydroxamate transport system substrate-binding protein
MLERDYRRWSGAVGLLATLGLLIGGASGAFAASPTIPKLPNCRTVGSAARPQYASTAFTDYADTLSGTKFPITVTSYQTAKRLGTAVLRKAATRIVSLDSTQITDAMLYLHANLVGATNSAFTQPLYTAMLKARHVKQIGNRPNWDFEEIAALHPDLIVATPAEYDTYFQKFSAIAPTVAVGAGSGAPSCDAPWAYYTAQAAVLTGKSAEVPGILKAETAAAASLEPRLKGYSVDLVQPFPTASKITNCYDSLFAFLGADVNVSLEANDCDVVSSEALNTLTAKNIVVDENAPGSLSLKYLESQPLWPAVPAVVAAHVYDAPQTVGGLYYVSGPISYFAALKAIPLVLKDLPKAKR